MSPLRNGTDDERPSIIVCIAYRQSSTMTGIKDLTEQSKKVEETNEGNKRNNAIIKMVFGDFKIQSMQNFIDFSKNIAESFRLFLENIKAQIEQFRAETNLYSIYDRLNVNSKPGV